MPDANDIAVKVERVCKTYKEAAVSVQALKEVNFVAQKGELLMIVGPSGCGKTTLLSVIAGTMRFDSGEVEVFDQSLQKMTDDEITEFRKKHIGFIFQQFHLIKTLSLLENVAIPSILNGCDRSQALQSADAILEKVGLEGRGEDKPFNLSGGQQQRVAIARALIHEPDLLICDEPTSALDAETGAKVLEVMTNIAKAPNRCVIVVTHDSRIFKYADRIAKMDDGRLVGIENNRKGLL